MRAGAGGGAGPPGATPPPPGRRGLLGGSGIPEAQEAARARVRGRAAESFALKLPVPGLGVRPPSLPFLISFALKCTPPLFFPKVAGRQGSGRQVPSLAAQVPTRGPREAEEAARFPGSAVSGPRCLSLLPPQVGPSPRGAPSAPYLRPVLASLVLSVHLPPLCSKP